MESGSGLLLIDALDASRGGPAESAFKRLIEAVIELNGRWSVVASHPNIRPAAWT